MPWFFDPILTPWFRDERGEDAAASSIAASSQIVETEFPPITSAGLVFWGVGINYICMVIIGGGGYHIHQLQPIHITRFSQTTFAAQVLYALALGFTKNSLVCMLKRIFFTQSYAWIAYLILSLNVAWMLQTILTGILICRPITMNWDPTARGQCGNQTLAFAAMKKTYKVALICVFGFGLITVVFTAIRLYFVFNLDFTDISFSSIPLTIIGVIQLCVANMVYGTVSMVAQG
ncbi:hypothetical protein TrVFT333_009364 [Trichoderma virens FT-333]|nr:hypothetical protein TrVFT333_009364 [Trichoderma virens FT-333]